MTFGTLDYKRDDDEDYFVIAANLLAQGVCAYLPDSQAFYPISLT